MEQVELGVAAVQASRNQEDNLQPAARRTMLPNRNGR